MPPESIAEGLRLFRAGDIVRAREFAQAAIRLEPTSLVGLELLAIASARLEDYLRAKDAYRKLLCLVPENGRSWVGYADCDVLASEAETVLVGFRRAQICDACNPQILLKLAHQLLEKRDWCSAVDVLCRISLEDDTVAKIVVSNLAGAFSLWAADCLAVEDIDMAQRLIRKALVISPQEIGASVLTPILFGRLAVRLDRLSVLPRNDVSPVQEGLEYLNRYGDGRSGANWLGHNLDRMIEESRVLSDRSIDALDTIQTMALRGRLDTLLLTGQFEAALRLINQIQGKLLHFLESRQAAGIDMQNMLGFEISFLIQSNLQRVQIVSWLADPSRVVVPPFAGETYLVNVPVWGEAFNDRFLEIQVPRFAESMRRFLARRPNSRFVLQICTTRTSLPKLEAGIRASEIADLAILDFRLPLNDEGVVANARTYAVTGQTCAMLEARVNGWHVFPLHPNCYFEPDFFCRMIELCEERGTLVMLNPSIFIAPDKVEQLRELELEDRTAFIATLSAHMDDLASQRLHISQTDIGEGEIPAQLDFIFMRYDGFYAMRFLQLPPVYVSKELIQKLPLIHWSSYDDRYMEAVLSVLDSPEQVGVAHSWEEAFYVSIEYLEEQRRGDREGAQGRRSADFIKEYCDELDARNFCTPSRALMFRRELMTSSTAMKDSPDRDRYRADKKILDQVADEIERRARRPENFCRDYTLHVEMMRSTFENA